MSLTAPVLPDPDRPDRVAPRPEPSQHLRAVDPLPPPASAIQKLALCAFEAVEGHRPIAQLGRVITVEVMEDLRSQRRGRTELRSLTGDDRRPTATPREPHISSPRSGVVESVVVLQSEVKSTAVAIRFELEPSRQRWQATRLAIL